MRTTLVWVVAASLVGAAVGVAAGYWEARPWAAAGAVPAKPSAPAAEEASAGARAVIDETTYKFGKMESGAKQRHVFPIRNEGKIPLTIEFVSHTCKCTTVELDGRLAEPGVSAVVPPGKETTVLLEWAAKVPAGPFRHGATFTTNDPAHDRVEIMVEGDIVESTTLYPAQLSFGDVLVGNTGKAEMYVMSFLEPQVEILSYEVTDEKLANEIEITIEPVDKSQLPSPGAAAGVRVTAAFKPGGAIGPFVGGLKLKTNLKQAPDLEVPIHGNVKGDISIFGALWNAETGVLRMDPGTTATGAKSSLRVAIRGPHAKDTKLTVASVKPPELKASLGEPNAIRDDLVHVPLTIEAPAGTRPMVRAGEDQGGEGEVIISTTHPDTPEVRLRVFFTIKP
jgi:hypothetical protein